MSEADSRYCPHGWYKGTEWCPVCSGEETEEEYYDSLDHANS